MGKEYMEVENCPDKDQKTAISGCMKKEAPKSYKDLLMEANAVRAEELQEASKELQSLLFKYSIELDFVVQEDSKGTRHTQIVIKDLLK